MPAAASERSRIRRVADRADYERSTVEAILDEGLVAHVGIVGDDGQPFVIPMLYARRGDQLLLHGSVASRLVRSLVGGVPVCVTVTLLDGLVLARSLFHHSVNYRSVVVLGCARPVPDADKADAVVALSERLVPGRSDAARGPSPAELRQTSVLALDLDEASAKVRTGGPKDEVEDLDRPVWAGVVPLSMVPGDPEPYGPDGPAAVPANGHDEAPEHVSAWRPTASRRIG